MRGSGLDRGDLDLGRVLTVTLTLPVAMMVIFGPLVGLTTSAVTLTLASLPASLVTVEPSTSRSGVRSMLSPASPFTLSMMRTSPTDTFSCRPPARTIAYTLSSLS